MKGKSCKFTVGQIIHHRLFDYRGMIVDIDPCFQGEEEWYARMAKSHPPREEPWYHVLVDGADYLTYVAERNITPSECLDPIQNPMAEDLRPGSAN